MVGRVLGVTVFALVAAGCAGSEGGGPLWEPRPEGIFVHRGTGETATLEQLLERANDLVRAGETDRALELYQIIARTGGPGHKQDPVRKAWLQAAKDLQRQERWTNAFDLFLSFSRRFPETPEGREARRALFETARRAIEKGTSKTFLVFSARSPEPGFDLMQRALEAFPREDYAPRYAIWFARTLYGLKEIGRAEKAARFIEREYRLPEEVVAEAVFLLGECALTRYQGTDYDPGPLWEADRHFLRVVQEFASTDAAERARKRRQEIKAELARKELIAGDFYRSRGRPQAAAVYYRSIVRNYPATEAARLAQRRLRELAALQRAPGKPPEKEKPSE